MATEPFYDLDRIDLGVDVADLAARRAILRQRGTFELIDAVHALTREPEVIVVSKRIRADDWWAPDHIPGRPLFPGVLMIETSAQAACFHYQSTRPEFSEYFIGFGGVEGVRFRASVEPPSTMIFQARLVRARSRMFTYDVQAWVERALVFEGTIMGIVL